MNDYRQPPRRMSLLKTFMASAFLCAGLFLFTPASASALDGGVFEPKLPKVNLVDKNEEKLKKLDESFKTERSKIEYKIETLEQIKQEADSIANKKEQLATNINDIKRQVEKLKAKVEEKKRLEALRIVPQSRYADDSAGNTYALGNCTWYVKSKRPDVSNGFGNANTWYIRAAAKGYKVGSMAKTGAIGVKNDRRLGHVVYVEKYIGDGRILISEMNYSGLYSTRTREAAESDFKYIYEL